MGIIQSHCGVNALVQILHEKFLEHVRDTWQPITVALLTRHKTTAEAALEALGAAADDISMSAVMAVLQQKVKLHLKSTAA